MLLVPDCTCWRLASAERATMFIDMADYFLAAKAAMSKAKRSIHLLNWAFEANTRFDPQPGCAGPDDDRFGPFLKSMAANNPDLDVRILCWDSALPVAATQHFFPMVDRRFFAGTKVRFVLDSKLPVGACHHQKMIVVDDSVAFCGGGDIGPDRWDTAAHLDDDPRREKTHMDNKCFDSRHEVMALVDGPPAMALGDLFRERWRRATGEALVAPAPVAAEAWPDGVEPLFRDISVGISRTVAAWKGSPEVRESEALSLASIAAATRCIYMENQYFTSPVVAEALAARLEEADGPEVVLVSTQHSPSYFDQMTMDRTRSNFIKCLKTADRHGRFRVYSPVTALGRTIIVHAKLAIIDDRLLRVGSANINNRSTGFDTECDVSLETKGGGDQARIVAAIRVRLVAHWLGCSTDLVEEAIAREGGVGAGIEALRASGHCRLLPIEPEPLGPLATFIATFHLGDPVTPTDSWRPWKRRRRLARELDRLRGNLRAPRAPGPPANEKGPPEGDPFSSLAVSEA
ncbi:MAG: phospholipase D-like domain-containing protein [Caulobacteraceae bacterium]